MSKRLPQIEYTEGYEGSRRTHTRQDVEICDMSSTNLKLRVQDTMPPRRKTIKSKTIKQIHDHVEKVLKNVRKQPGVMTWYGKERHCWLYQTKAKAPKIYYSDPHVAFYNWRVYKKENHLPQDQQVRTKLLKQVRKTKKGEGEQQVIRHRCGNSKCCNPKHLKLGTPKDQEEDKHYHYFLHKDKESGFDENLFAASMAPEEKRMHLHVRGERLW